MSRDPQAAPSGERVPEPPPHDPPFPPYELAYRTGSLRDAEDPFASYDELGREARSRILELLPAGWELRGKRVLDFGCGAGRVLRHFADDRELREVLGCDIDGASIEWIAEHLGPPVRAFRNDETPPLPLEQDSCDLVYALSVFTHLTDSWSAWLAELHRVLRPDGLLIATFLGPERAGRVLSDSVTGGAVDPDRTGMNELAHGRPWDKGGPLVVHSRWWIEEHWGRAFELVQLEERGFWRHWDQGFAVMRPRPAALSAADLEAPAADEPRELESARENVRQLGRQLAPLWADVHSLRDRLRESRSAVSRLRAQREEGTARISALERENAELRRRLAATEGPSRATPRNS